MTGRGRTGDPVPLPAAWRIGVRVDTRIEGDLLLGGHPARVVRLDAPTAAVVAQLRDGATVDDAASTGAEAGVIARLLVDGGFGWAEPAAGGSAAPSASDVTLVVPALDAAEELPRLLAGLPAAISRIVVDDGSSDGTGEVAKALGADVVRHAAPLGPAAARNAGWRLASTPLVLFADADADLPEDWDAALDHFADPLVGVVVPRVRPTGGDGGVASAYETARSGYDLGDEPGEVGPDRRRTAAASVLLFARVEALEAIGGFADDLRFGEDHDLIGRLDLAGWVVRYEPLSVGGHRVRTRFGDVLRLHRRYGEPAAELCRRRHVYAAWGAVTPSAVIATVLLLRGRFARATVLGAFGCIAHAAVLARRVPLGVAVQVARRAEARSLRTVAAGVTGPWLAVACLLLGRRRRSAAVITGLVAARHLEEWRRLAEPKVPAPLWVALRVVDDLALHAGTWQGCAEAKWAAPLLPGLLRWRPVTGPSGGRRAPGWSEVAVYTH